MSNLRETRAAAARAEQTTGTETDTAAASRLSARARALIAIGAVALFAAGLAGWLIIIWKAIAVRAGRFDFSAYYAAARALRLNPHANIYSIPVLSASAIAGHVLAPPGLPYLYTPLPALLLTPLTLFSFPVAADIFFAINVLAWLLCMLVVAREVHQLLGTSLATHDGSPARGALGRLLADPAPLVALAICAPLFFLGRPGVSTLGNGQINFLVLLPLAYVPWLTRHGHERSVGVAIAFATMLKLTPAVLLLYLLLRRRWHALGAALITLVALTALCLLIVGPHVFFVYPASFLQYGGANALFPDNEALVAPVLFAVTSTNPALAPVARMCEYILLGVLAAELGIILYRSRPTSAIRLTANALRCEALAYAIALSAVVLLSPAAWAHHYVWLLPAGALVLGFAIRAIATHPAHTPERRAVLALFAGAVLAGVLLNLPLPNGWDTDPVTRALLLFGRPLRPWLQELRPLGGLLIVAIAATLLLRAHTTIPIRRASWTPKTTSLPAAGIPAPLPASQP